MAYHVQTIKRSPTELVAASLVNVNNTSYAANGTFAFTVDLGTVPYNQFRVVCAGSSSAGGATITLLLATFAAVDTAVSSGDTGLVVSNTPGIFDSGWKTRTDGATGLKEYHLSMKGSASTTDLSVSYLEVHFRRV